MIIDSSEWEKRPSIGQQTNDDVKPTLLVFSANHPDSLQKLTEKYRDYIDRSSVSLRDLAYTLGVRREHMLYKSFGITDGMSFEASSTTKSDSTLVPAFVFTGQGAQWPRMGKELIADYDSFRADIRKMDISLSQLKHAPSWKIEGLFPFQQYRLLRIMLIHHRRATQTWDRKLA